MLHAPKATLLVGPRFICFQATDRWSEDFFELQQSQHTEIMRLMSVAHQRALRGQRGGGGDDSDNAVQRCGVCVSGRIGG
jgi:hypothetical protein